MEKYASIVPIPALSSSHYSHIPSIHNKEDVEKGKSKCLVQALCLVGVRSNIYEEIVCLKLPLTYY